MHPAHDGMESITYLSDCYCCCCWCCLCYGDCCCFCCCYHVVVFVVDRRVLLEYRAVPALEHAAPAVGTLPEGVGLGGGSAGGAPFHGLNMAFARTGRAHALIPADTLYSSSPVNGLLFVRGTIGGKVSFPAACLHLCCCIARYTLESCLHVVMLMDIFYHSRGLRSYSRVYPSVIHSCAHA